MSAMTNGGKPEGDVVLTCAESNERLVLDVSALFSAVLADQSLPLHLRERIVGVAASFEKAPGQASELRRAAAAVLKDFSLQSEQRKSSLLQQRKAQLRATEAEKRASKMEKKAEEAQKQIDELVDALKAKLDSQQLAIVTEEVRKAECSAEEKAEDLKKQLLQRAADLELSLLRTQQLEKEAETSRREIEQLRSCIASCPQTPPSYFDGRRGSDGDIEIGPSASQVGRSPYVTPDPLPFHPNQKLLHSLIAGSERASEGGSIRMGMEGGRKRSARRAGTSCSHETTRAHRDSSGNAVFTRFIVLGIACVGSYLYGHRHGRASSSASA